MAVIGKFILDNLTVSMYKDSLVCFREYIQNSCDQIDKAVKEGLVTIKDAEIEIFIDEKSRTISIDDNATGVKESEFISLLGDIANSDKVQGEDKGFRGIGRLCGLAYCKSLVFTTSYAGENIASRMVYNGEVMRERLSDKTKHSVDEILSEIVSVETFAEDSNKHYFKVELQGINRENTDLLDSKKVREYLSFTAPVSYENYFHLSSEIYKHAESLNYKIDEYKISVNGVPVFKGYTNKLYEGNENNPKHYDDISRIAFKDIYDDDNNLIAWLWYGLSRFEKVIPKALNSSRGFRVRQSNIQIGDNVVLAGLFKEPRGNNYFVGEVFVVDKRITPNSQRDYFSENKARVTFEDKLRIFFYDELHKIYYSASATKNNLKRIKDAEELEHKYREKQIKGFLDKDEQIKAKNQLEEAIKKSDEAKKQLAKTVDTLPESVEEMTPLQYVQRVIKKDFDEKRNTNDAKAKSNNKSTKEIKKVKYFTDNLSKLGRNDRKLVQQIMGLVNKVAPEEIAAKIQEAIEREYR